MIERMHTPEDKLGALLRSALIKEADLMETRYWIARLRRLQDLMLAEAEQRSRAAQEAVGAVPTALLDGQSLGLSRASMLVDELRRELVADAARQLRL